MRHGVAENHHPQNKWSQNRSEGDVKGDGQKGGELRNALLVKIINNRKIANAHLDDVWCMARIDGGWRNDPGRCPGVRGTLLSKPLRPKRRSYEWMTGSS